MRRIRHRVRLPVYVVIVAHHPTLIVVGVGAGGVVVGIM